MPLGELIALPRPHSLFSGGPLGKGRKRNGKGRERDRGEEKRRGRRKGKEVIVFVDDLYDF